MAENSKARVYRLGKVSGEPNVVFVEHTEIVANLCDHILVSGCDKGELITWHSVTGNVVDKLNDGDAVTSVAKLDENRFAFGMLDGDASALYA